MPADWGQIVVLVTVLDDFLGVEVAVLRAVAHQPTSPSLLVALACLLDGLFLGFLVIVASSSDAPETLGLLPTLYRSDAA